MNKTTNETVQSMQHLDSLKAVKVAMDMNKIKDVIQPIIINALNNKSRNGGVLSSKEALDNGLTV